MNRPNIPISYTLFLCIAFLCSITYSCTNPNDTDNQTTSSIQIAYPSQHYDEALDGRMIVLITQHVDAEPRFQLRDDAKTCQAFGMDVTNWQPGEHIDFDMDAFGYPIQNFKDLPEGDFFAQVLFHKYETFNRADGHTVKLPMDRGEGQQ